MKQPVHSYEDKLLDFAYGELPPHEAKAVEAHLKGCAKCSDALGSIRGVRSAMSALPAEPAPDKGLESLLAYAEQAARRSAVGPAPGARWWRRVLIPVGGALALGLVGVIAYRSNSEVKSPSESIVAYDAEKQQK